MQLDSLLVSVNTLKQIYSLIIFYLVEEGVEGPGEEEADPANGHDDPHLAQGQGVRDPIDVNQLHVGLDAQLCGDGQPGNMNSEYCKDENYFLLNIYPRLRTTNIRKYRDCLMNVGSCPTLLPE